MKGPTLKAAKNSSLAALKKRLQAKGQTTKPVKRRITAPDLSPLCLQQPIETYPGFERAKASAKRACNALSRKKVMKDVPLPLDIQFSEDSGNVVDASVSRTEAIVAFYAERGDWLKHCRGNINAAIDAGDEKFFLSLAKLMHERRKYRGRSFTAWFMHQALDDDPRPVCRTDTFREIIASKWIDWGLWLLPSPTATDVIKHFTDLPLTDANFEFLRKELRLAKSTVRLRVFFDKKTGILSLI